MPSHTTWSYGRSRSTTSPTPAPRPSAPMPVPTTPPTFSTCCPPDPRERGVGGQQVEKGGGVVGTGMGADGRGAGVGEVVERDRPYDQGVWDGIGRGAGHRVPGYVPRTRHPCRPETMWSCPAPPSTRTPVPSPRCSTPSRAAT